MYIYAEDPLAIILDGNQALDQKDWEKARAYLEDAQNKINALHTGNTKTRLQAHLDSAFTKLKKGEATLVTVIPTKQPVVPKNKGRVRQCPNPCPETTPKILYSCAMEQWTYREYVSLVLQLCTIGVVIVSLIGAFRSNRVEPVRRTELRRVQRCWDCGRRRLIRQDSDL